ncbi:MAG: hypothetical protein LKJ47_07925 [Bifidobacteriaceae bacterium]|nr:hypothetical protein [Bifidobacteriaceae bacterium]
MTTSETNRNDHGDNSEPATSPMETIPIDAGSDATQPMPAVSSVPTANDYAYYDSATRTRAEEKMEYKRRRAAWKQQQRASKMYAHEAWRNGYPGNGYANGSPANGAPGTGTPGNYGAASWNPADPNAYPRPVYKRGPNVGAIVWGCIMLLVGVVALLWFLLPNIFLNANIWAIIFSIAFAAIGLSLVIGAIVSSLSGLWRKKGSEDSADSVQ